MDLMGYRSRWRTTAVLCVAAAVMVSRAPEWIFQPQVYAEDGPVYFVQQRTMGLRAIIQPYEGYLQLYSRLAAEFAALFTAGLTPALYVSSAIVALLWTCATLSVSGLRLGWLYALAIVLIPHNGEIYALLTNTTWFFAAGILFLAVAPNPVSNIGRANEIAFVVIGGLSTLFSALVVPAFLWRIWSRHDRYSVVLGTVGAATGIAQGIFAITFKHRPAEANPDPSHFINLMFARIFPSFDQPAVIAALLLLVAAALALNPTRDRLALIVFATVAFGSLALVYYKFSHARTTLFDYYHMHDRYHFLPRIAIFAAGASLLFSPAPITYRAAGGLLLLLLMTGHNVMGWKKIPETPKEWAAFVPDIDSGKPVYIVTNPGGWALRLPAITTTRR